MTPPACIATRFWSARRALPGRAARASAARGPMRRACWPLGPRTGAPAAAGSTQTSPRLAVLERLALLQTPKLETSEGPLLPPPRRSVIL